jgi:DNA-binding transcriptional LysR family regulator
VDLSILRGDGKWPGYKATQMFGETVFPVCSPEFLAATPGIANVQDLTQVSLIEVESAHSEWMNWRAWLAQNGVTRATLRQTMVFNTYPLSIQAAVDGVGIALGWGHLVDRLLDSGALVRPLGPTQVRTQHGYFLLVAEGRVQSAGAREVADWLTQVSASRRRYGAPHETTAPE